MIERIQSFFKRPKAKAKAEEAKPATKAVEEKTTEAPEKKTGGKRSRDIFPYQTGLRWIAMVK